MPNLNEHGSIAPPVAVLTGFLCLRTSVPQPGSHRQTDLVEQVRRVIEELLIDGATLEQVAARMDMSARRLREQLAQANVRFNDLLGDCRCSLAKRLLVDTDERIESIAERTGFSEPSTFCRAFKRWVGETPAAFRRRGHAA